MRLNENFFYQKYLIKYYLFNLCLLYLPSESILALISQSIPVSANNPRNKKRNVFVCISNKKILIYKYKYY